MPRKVLLVALAALVVASDLAEAATCPASVIDSSSCDDICRQKVEKNGKEVIQYPCVHQSYGRRTEQYPATVYGKTDGVTACKCCCDPNDALGSNCNLSGGHGLWYPYECDVNSKPDPKPGPKPESPAPGGTVQSGTCQQMGITTSSDCKQKCHGETQFSVYYGKYTCKCGGGRQVCTDGGGGGGGGGVIVVLVLLVVAAGAAGLLYAYRRKQQAQNPNVYDPMQDKHADVGFSSA